MDTGRRPQLEELSLFIDGLVSETDRNRIQAWLESDAELQAEYRLLQSLQQTMAEDEPELEQKMFTDARMAILDAVKEESANPAPGAWTDWVCWLSPQRLVPVAVGVCSLLFAIVLFTGNGDQEISSPKEPRDQIVIADPTPAQEPTGPDPVQLTPEQTEQAQVALDYSRKLLVSTAETVGDKAENLGSTTAEQFSAMQTLATTRGKALWDAGSTQASEVAKSIGEEGKRLGEPMARWTLRQAQFDAGTTLLGVVLTIV